MINLLKKLHQAPNLSMKKQNSLFCFKGNMKQSSVRI